MYYATLVMLAVARLPHVSWRMTEHTPVLWRV